MPTGLRNVRLLARREFRQRYRSRGYRVATLMGALLVAGLAFAPAIMESLDNTSQRTVAVVDSGGTAAALQRELPEVLPNGQPRIAVEAVPTAAVGLDGLADQRYHGVLEPSGDGGAWAYTTRGSSPEARRLEAAVAGVMARARLAEAGIDEAQAAEIFQRVDLERRTLDGAAADDSPASTVLVYALLALLYFTLIVYGSTVSSAIIQEKASRITEILMSSVTPAQHVTGKLLGIGLAGLLQYACWIAAASAVLLVDRLGTGRFDLDISAVPPATFAYFLLFFLLGYALYGALSAALCSPASRAEDAAMLTAPLSVLMILGFGFSYATISDPAHPVAVTASLIPVFTPMVMFSRVALGHPPGWEVLLSVGLTLASVVAAVWLLARVYRIGVLMYGKRPTLSEFLRMARVS